MKKKILLVDNETDLTFMFKRGLEYAGLHVDVFHNSSEVIRAFKPHFYDLLVLDIVMPDMDGFDLYKELKKLDPDVKVCFLTASQKHLGEFRRREYQELGRDLFIQKPISIKDLAKEIYRRVG
jgi:DNA-binding response OmpR family regulator